jgi:hypothetical protein
VVAANFNGDGKADVGVFCGYLGAETKLFELLGTSTGLTSSAQVWDSGPNNWDLNVIKPVVGNFNNDSCANIAVFYGIYGSRTTIGAGAGFTIPTAAIWDSGANGWNWAPTLIG